MKIHSMSVSLITTFFCINQNSVYADLTHKDGTIEILEEVIVTAQKREESIQKVPLAIAALNSDQLSTMGISSLDGLADSVISSLRVSPNGSSSSSLTIAIRGDGPPDAVQPTSQGPVAIYADGIYLGRANGLTMELADTKRIEILRGPQGTLFGRNSTSGAINIISNDATGEFSVDQLVGRGNYDAFRSVTRINLPAIGGIASKVDYVHSSRNGWVNNTLPGQADFNEYNKDGGKISLNWDLTNQLNVKYAYDQSDIQSAQVYFQLYEDMLGAIGQERNRQSKTRFPLVLQPTDVDSLGHSLIMTWELNEAISINSLSGYRELDEDGFNNYGGTLYSGGLIIDQDIEQHQISQEFQIIGAISEIIDWVSGIYYFEEQTDFDIQFLSSLDMGFNPVVPPMGGPVTRSTGNAESIAIYGQAAWHVNKKLTLTLGARYTEDDKSARRAGFLSPDINSENTDISTAISYAWSENLLTYLRYATAYKAGGYNSRSVSFLPYLEEKNKAWEAGIKSQWFDQHLRINAAFFINEYDDKQFDFIDPSDTTVVETLNAKKQVELTGFEFELSFVPFSGFVLGANYTYLDGDMPIQPHPDGSGATQRFVLIQTPTHSGAITTDYIIANLEVGTLKAHIDVTSTSRYAHTTFPSSREDAYMLINARLTLDDVSVGNDAKLGVSLWGRNLADEEYANLGFPIGTPPVTTIQSFGTPRTYGIDLTLKF